MFTASVIRAKSHRNIPEDSHFDIHIGFLSDNQSSVLTYAEYGQQKSVLRYRETTKVGAEVQGTCMQSAVRNKLESKGALYELM
jgi:hypothetical protein